MPATIFFVALYADPARLEGFLRAMTGASLSTAHALADAFPWYEVRSFVDVGCAQGGLTAVVAAAHPHLTGIGFDLPPVGPVFQSYIAGKGLSDRVGFQAGSFFEQALPTADVVIMGHILHDWDLDQKRLLIAKAYEALPKGGRFIAYDAIIDDDRRHNAFGLLMSLNMLVEDTRAVSTIPGRTVSAGCATRALPKPAISRSTGRIRW